MYFHFCRRCLEDFVRDNRSARLIGRHLRSLLRPPRPTLKRQCTPRTRSGVAGTDCLITSSPWKGNTDAARQTKHGAPLFDLFIITLRPSLPLLPTAANGFTRPTRHQRQGAQDQDTTYKTAMKMWKGEAPRLVCRAASAFPFHGDNVMRQPAPATPERVRGVQIYSLSIVPTIAEQKQRLSMTHYMHPPPTSKVVLGHTKYHPLSRCYSCYLSLNPSTQLNHYAFLVFRSSFSKHSVVRAFLRIVLLRPLIASHLCISCQTRM